jgi:hypothetical protein
MSRYITNKGTKENPNMGCDIHLWVVRYKNGQASVLQSPEQEWHEAQGDEATWDRLWTKWRLATARNYERFAALSGVRGDGPEANGWPDWAQALLPEAYENCDLHSHTHMKVKKAAKIWVRTEWQGDDERKVEVSPKALLARANPYAMYFQLDEDADLNNVWILIAYDN